MTIIINSLLITVGIFAIGAVFGLVLDKIFPDTIDEV